MTKAPVSAPQDREISQLRAELDKALEIVAQLLPDNRRHTLQTSLQNASELLDTVERTLCRVERERNELLIQLGQHVDDSRVDVGPLGESIFASITGRERNAPRSLVDFGEEGEEGAARFEVKCSRPNPIRKDGTTYRWRWGKIKGSGGTKVYTNLILIGCRPTPLEDAPSELDARYAFFDIPWGEVDQFLLKGGAGKMIHLNLNPTQSKGKATALHQRRFRKWRTS